MSKEWIPHLPQDWQHTQIRHLARVFAGGTPDRKNPDFWVNGSTPWLNSGAVNQGRITEPSEYVTDLAASTGATRWVHQASVVVALAGQGKTKGMAARTEIDTTLNQSLAAIEPGPRLDYRFLHYWLMANYQNLRGLAGGDLRDGLNLDHIGSVHVPLPPTAEQQLIADYLDRETAEIDAFIEDHERLLQLLDERVTTTIEATILGVDAATTVDTGQEWPATLPFGWTAQRVSWLFDATGSGTTPTSDDVDAFDGDIPWVTTGELREKAISTSEKKVSSETLRRYSALKVHPTGSLLIAMYGATIGRVGWLEVPATVNQAVCVLSGYKAGPLRFPYYALLAARPYLLTLASGGGQPNINQDKIRSLRLPVPPPAEQERIVAELDHTLEAEYAMRRDVERSLELARERKTALISAAVTGQIDVAAQDVSAAEQLRDELEAHL